MIKVGHAELSKSPCSLHEAAAASTAPEERNGRSVVSTVHALSIESLRVIWEAASWPTEFNDPLLSKGFSESEQFQTMTLFPGLHEFLEFDKSFYSAAGKVRERSAEEQSRSKARNPNDSGLRLTIRRLGRWLQTF